MTTPISNQQALAIVQTLTQQGIKATCTVARKGYGVRVADQKFGGVMYLTTLEGWQVYRDQLPTPQPTLTQEEEAEARIAALTEEAYGIKDCCWEGGCTDSNCDRWAYAESLLAEARALEQAQAQQAEDDLRADSYRDTL